MSHSRTSRRDECFHPHHSGTYSAREPLIGPDELLALAPNEFVHPESFLQALYVLPQNLLIACMKAYRTVVSPLYGNVCRYYPTCSAYALEAFTTHGALGGLSLTVRRILRCVPGPGGEAYFRSRSRTENYSAQPPRPLYAISHLLRPPRIGGAFDLPTL